jgi:adenine-specific DNA methylase
LLNISNYDKSRILAQFSDNPRSRQTANLVREIYGETLNMSLPQAVKRIGELVAECKFEVESPKIPSLADPVYEELSERGSAVSDEPDEEVKIPKTKAAPLDFLSEVERIKAEHGGAIVMWQVGDFYELYNEDAKNAAAVLTVSIIEINRDISKPYLLAGIPNNTSFDDYRQKLINAGYSVAVSSVGDDGERKLVLYEVETPQTSRIPYKVGDTVFLEDGKAYQIRKISEYTGEVELHDPTQGQYVIRPESKERFEELLAMYDGSETAEVTVQNDTDSHLLNISDYDKSRILTQFTNNPRSRETANLVREIYGETQFPISQIMKRIAELIADGKFTVAEIKQLETPENTGIIPDEPPIITENLSQLQTAVNFKITNEHLGEGGAKTKYAWNIAAIKTLQSIELKNRPAKSEEQEILSKYVGWGGIPQVFDENNESWAKEFLELHGLLSESEYASARASTLNAHYTSPLIINAIYTAIERMGFTTGNILEPSCGVGNFWGLLPESMAKSRLYGVELDSITGRLAQKLYPKADIKVTGFEKASLPDNFFDILVGNIPFGDYKVSDLKYDKYNFRIHDYFFAKALDQTRPGGIIAFVTSKGTLDKKNPD